MKGQSAVEYLTTYGWVLVAIIITAAVFIQMDIISIGEPERPERTTLFGTTERVDILWNDSEGTTHYTTVRIGVICNDSIVCYDDDCFRDEKLAERYCGERYDTRR